ncbi:MAG: hypothetical protein F9K18_10655, partial [Thermoanaerobaculia bacterium]
MNESHESGHRALLGRTAKLAAGYLDSLPERAVGPTASLAELRAALGGELPAASFAVLPSRA